MPELAAFFFVNRRIGRAAFLFAVPLVLAIGVGCAALVYNGRVEALLGYLAAAWSWLCLHANRCHDTGWSGKPLVIAWPLVLIGLLTLGGAVVLVAPIALPGASPAPAGEIPPLDFAYSGIAAALALAGVDITGVRPTTAILTAAALPLIASLIVTIPILFAPDDPGPNRWGEPAW